MITFSDFQSFEVDEDDVENGLQTYIEIEMGVGEILDEFSFEDIIELIDELGDRGYLQDMKKIDNEFDNFDDLEWSKTIVKLSDQFSRLRLSNEDIELIKQISNKL
jgi:hypothetical protein